MKTTSRLKNLHRPEYRVDAELTAAGDTKNLYRPEHRRFAKRRSCHRIPPLSYKTQNLQIKLIVFSIIRG